MIGILALQGSFREHQKILEVLGQRTVLVKKPSQLEAIDGLVIGGGESTTISLLIQKYGFKQPLKKFVAKKPVFATCAGLIILSKEVEGGKVSLPVLDINVKRNAFGRQIDSFEEDLAIPVLGKKPYPAVFIRAPYIKRAGKDVDVLARHKRKAVAIRQENIIATAFHPELTNDTRFHQHLISIIRKNLPIEHQPLTTKHQSPKP